MLRVPILLTRVSLSKGLRAPNFYHRGNKRSSLLSAPGRGVLEFEGIGDLQSPFPGTVISKDNISDPAP